MRLCNNFDFSAMSTQKTNAQEVRESIEAKTGAEDTEMKDADTNVNVDDVDAEGEDVDMDAEGEDDVEGDLDAEGRPDLYRLISTLSTYLCNVEEEFVPTCASVWPLTNHCVLKW